MTRPIFCWVNEFMFFFIVREMVFRIIEGAVDSTAPPYLTTEKLTFSAPFVFSTWVYIENYGVKLNKMLNYFIKSTSKTAKNDTLLKIWKKKAKCEPKLSKSVGSAGIWTRDLLHPKQESYP